MEKCEFKERLVIVEYLGAIAIMVFIALLYISTLIAEHFGALAFCAFLLISSATLGAATLVLYNFKGLIRADRNGVNIKILLFGIPLSEQSYEYGDIKRVSCTVEKHNTRSLKYYDMIFVFWLPDGKELCFSKRLKIRFNLDRKKPYAYGAAVSGEPMMQTYDFIMSNKSRIFRENNPE